jgi:acetyl esterase/lipase
MSQTVFLRHLARHSARVAISRLRRGPVRPSWSFAFELFTTALRHTSLEISKRDWALQRVAFDALATPPFLADVFHRVVREPVKLGGVPAEWFVPKTLGIAGSPSGDVTLLYFHGGAYIFGSLKSHGELIARLALASPARTIAPEYRLAPEHPFPAAIDDAVAVYRALLASGTDPKRLVVAGDSAGGGLTMSLLLRLRDAGEPLPAGAALICPWVDLTAKGGSLTENAPFDWADEETAHRWIATYLNGHDRRDPLVSPVFADLTGLPPLLVQVGGAELLHDQARMLAERAKEANVDARFVVEPDMVHDWHSFAGVFAHCARAIDDVGAFVRSVT